jgi:hypothetical protein
MFNFAKLSKQRTFKDFKTFPFYDLVKFFFIFRVCRQADKMRTSYWLLFIFML